MSIRAILMALSVLSSCFSVAHAQSATEIALGGMLDEHLPAVCSRFSNLPDAACKSLVTSAARSTAGLDVDRDQVKETVSAAFKDPEYLNSVLAKSYGDSIPLGLEFKTIDSENGDNVLGLTYNYDYEILSHDTDPSSNWRKRVELSFKANGTVVNNSEDNPRNFLDTRFSLLRAYTTRIPEQDEEFGTKLTDNAVAAAIACTRRRC